ncbi:MAG: site-specific DNA-methyltransferase [Lactobacillaceae bacterium]|jgi:DNA modification methylase|nr:site-specific DNA-methyltransferase [Lactobacillaceae bacterium]
MTESKGKYDSRNKLNNLTGTEWLKLTKSFLFSEKCADDKDAFKHPAPFLIKDVEKMISLFTKEGMVILDPFMGSGTTSIAAYNLKRLSIGIDLSNEYKKLATERFAKKGMQENKDYKYIVGDSTEKLRNIESVDFVITSPPYHNILKNNAKGLRKDSSAKGFRSGSRIGVEYYSDNKNDLGNQDTYEDFLKLLKKVMKHCFNRLRNDKYCSIIISDFTVDKKEICVQADIVKLMTEIGFEFVGTIALLQDNKPLYPFGYPYSFKINHMHQNIINFRKAGV